MIAKRLCHNITIMVTFETSQTILFPKVYNAEIAHPEMRGSLGAIIPAMASLGTLYTFLVSNTPVSFIIY